MELTTSNPAQIVQYLTASYQAPSTTAAASTGTSEYDNEPVDTLEPSDETLFESPQAASPSELAGGSEIEQQPPTPFVGNYGYQFDTDNPQTYPGTHGNDAAEGGEAQWEMVSGAEVPGSTQGSTPASTPSSQPAVGSQVEQQPPKLFVGNYGYQFDTDNPQHYPGTSGNDAALGGEAAWVTVPGA